MFARQGAAHSNAVFAVVFGWESLNMIRQERSPAPPCTCGSRWREGRGDHARGRGHPYRTMWTNLRVHGRTVAGHRQSVRPMTGRYICSRTAGIVCGARRARYRAAGTAASRRGR